jgi:hypothetical protein
MPFWNRNSNDRHQGQVERSYIEQTANQAIHDLAAGEDPVNSIAVEMMLKWIWQPDPPKTRALHRVLGARGSDPDLYSRFLYELIPSDDIEPPLQPYPVIAERMPDLLAGYLFPERTPLGEREDVKPNHIVIDNALAMIGRLKMANAHHVVCRLLSAAQFRLQKRSWGVKSATGSGIPLETEARDLIAQTTACLLALPPDAIPQFWLRLRGFDTMRDFSPIAAQMRDRRAVPYLVEALAHLDEDGQSELIMALAKIKDSRAVPALQELAADKSRLVAPIAAHALAEILRTSHDDAAQLLRATDSRHAGNAADTLLRAAAPTPHNTTPADQLLRADTQEHDPARNTRKDQ